MRCNVGAHAASGDVLAFVDSDAYPDPQWIDARAHRNPKLPNVFLNPSDPAVRNYLIALIADFARPIVACPPVVRLGLAEEGFNRTAPFEEFFGWTIAAHRAVPTENCRH